MQLQAIEEQIQEEVSGDQDSGHPANPKEVLCAQEHSERRNAA